MQAVLLGLGKGWSSQVLEMWVGDGGNNRTENRCEDETMIPDELTKEQKTSLLHANALVMELRVLCTEDQLDKLNEAMHRAGVDHSLFIVHHQTFVNLEDSDVEEALENEGEIQWGKL